MGCSKKRQQGAAWQRFQAAADALRHILPKPPKQPIPWRPSPVPAVIVDGIRAQSERALRMAREAGMAVDMKNNWPQT